MKTAIVYSSLTGNTQKVAAAIQEVFGPEGELFPIDQAPDARGYDLVAVGFWVDRGTADAKAQAYLKSLHHSRVALFATLGAYPDSAHAADSMKRAAELLAEDNQLVGTFICQGKIAPRLLEQFKTLPADHPHAINPERQARHAVAAKHPDEKDLLAAQEVFLRIKEEVSRACTAAS